MKFKFNNSYLFKEVEDEAVLVSLDACSIYSLNETAKDILKMLNQKSLTKKEIIDGLLCDYNTDFEEVNSDVEEFISEGIKKGYLIKNNN